MKNKRKYAIDDHYYISPAKTGHYYFNTSFTGVWENGSKLDSYEYRVTVANAVEVSEKYLILRGIPLLEEKQEWSSLLDKK